MGYYVTYTGSLTLKPGMEAQALAALKALNGRHENKSGGQYPASAVRPADSQSVSDNPNEWYAWMPWNYDELCDSVADVLEMLGFDWYEDGEIGYDSKIGDEDVFLRALGPFVEAGNVINCRGEDGELWRYVFDGSTATIQNGRIVYE